MSTFQLESGVQLPPTRNSYPFADMKVQDSFEIIGELESRKVRNAAYQFAKKVNSASKEAVAKGEPGEAEVKFVLRKVDEVDSGEKDDKGEAIMVKIYRLWRA